MTERRGRERESGGRGEVEREDIETGKEEGERDE